MHLWLLFQLLVIKGTIIMTASNVLWWWAAIFPLITPSQSLIYCQSSSLRHAAISCLRGRELAWKMEEKNQKARGEIGECLFDGSRDSLLLLRHLNVSGCFLSTQYCLKTRKQKSIWLIKIGHICVLHIVEHTYTCRFDVSSNTQ